MVRRPRGGRVPAAAVRAYNFGGKSAGASQTADTTELATTVGYFNVDTDVLDTSIFTIFVFSLLIVEWNGQTVCAHHAWRKIINIPKVHKSTHFT